MKPELLLQNADFVQCLAHSLVANSSCADDVMQETWIAALDRDPGEHYLKPWLSRVVKNISIKFLRSETRRSRYEREAARSMASEKTGSLTPADRYDRKIIRSRLMKAVMELNQPYRQAIMLRYFDNLPPREIAKYLEMPVERVKAHLKRGLAQLREKLDRTFDGDRKRWVLALLPFTGLAAVGEATAATSATTSTTGFTAKTASPFTMKTASPFTVKVASPAPFVKVMVAASALLCLTTPLFFFFSTILADPLENGGGPLHPAAVSERHASNETASLGMIGLQEKERLGPDQPMQELSGHILSRADEEGIENATVQVTLLPLSAGKEALNVNTTPSGAFKIPLPADAGRNLSALQFKVACPGFRDMERVISFNGDEDLQECGNFFLDENRMFTLHITDPDGEPIQGAHVACYKGISSLLIAEPFSDESGCAFITDRELGRVSGRIVSEDIRMHITAPGRAPALHDASTLYADREIPTQIVMLPEGTFSGQVVDVETGHAVTHAEVELLPVPEWSSFFEPMKARSDMTGTFEIPRFTFSRGVMLELVVNAKGYLPHLSRSYDRFNCRGTSFTGFDKPIRLQRATAMKRTVIHDASTGKPLPHLRLRAYLYDSLETSVVTDASGSLMLPFIQERQARITLHADGYEPYHYCYRCENDPPVPPGDPWEVSLVAKTAPLIVEVCDLTGNPLEEAVVSAYDLTGRIHLGSAFTDATGKAIVATQPNLNTKLRLKIEHPEYAPFYSDPVPAHGAEDSALSFVLEERAHLLQSIRIKDENGNPVPNMLIRAFLRDRNGKLIWNNIPNLFYGPTDINGYCDIVFPSFHAGSLHAVERVSRAEFVERVDTITKITFADVLEQKKVVLTLDEQQFEKHTIKGVVKDMYGNPVEGIYIAMERDSLSWQAQNDSGAPRGHMLVSRVDGSFTFVVGDTGLFTLSVPLQEMTGSDGMTVWYNAETIRLLSPGNCTTVTLKAWENRVHVSIEGNTESIRDKVWLETEEGVRITVEKVIHENAPTYLNGPAISSAAFFNVPSGEVKAVFHDEAGRRHESPLLVVKSRGDHHTRIQHDAESASPLSR